MFKNCFRAISAVIVILSMFYLSGCAFGTRRPMLEYTAVTPVKTPNNITIKVVSFSDNRPDKSVVGNVRNGWGIKTADVITDTNISDWATGALKTELQNAGYTIVETNAKNEIKGEVIKVYCDTFLSYEGEVMLKVSLKKGDSVLLDKLYSGKSSDMNWAATAKSYGIILQRSLQQAMIQAVGDVNAHLKE